MPNKGKFIVFEGLDGSGIDTQGNLLYDYLIKNNIPCSIGSEPTKGKIGLSIREFLQDNNKAGYTPTQKQQLFVADRVIDVYGSIFPDLRSGINVIRRRYFFSNIAYGYADGVDTGFLMNLNSEFLIPDIVIFLRVLPRICMWRIEEDIKKGKRRGKEHFESIGKLEKVNEGYFISFELFKSWFGKDVCILDGEDPLEKVFEQVKKLI